MESLAVLFAVGFAASWFGTEFLRKYALRRNMLDVPNGRSSHTLPTPRGGGVAFAVTFLVLFLGLVFLGEVSRTGLIVALAGAVVAAVGFADDRGVSLSAGRRLFFQFSATGVFLLTIGGMTSVHAFGHVVEFGWFGNVLAALFVVWAINFSNFMDGIDGIASLEAISVSLLGALCWWLATGSQNAVVPLLFACCVAGFLCWNFPPARIFMGDSGSCLIGFVLASAAIWSGQEAKQLFWAWCILIGCFSMDATVTLVRRKLRGYNVAEAHRSHAYQYAARRWNSHKKVSMAVVAINLLWLAPIAILVSVGKLDGVAGLLVAYTPLVAGAFALKAGAPELQSAPAPASAVASHAPVLPEPQMLAASDD